VRRAGKVLPERGVSECDLETSAMRRFRPTGTIEPCNTTVQAETVLNFLK